MFRKLHQHYPTSPEITYFIGCCLLNEGHFESALNSFRMSLQLNPHQDRNVYIYMAICLKAMNNLSAAISILDEVTDKNPQFEEAFFYKGKIFFKLKNYHEAIQNFKKCLALNQKNDLAYIQMSDCLKIIGKTTEALRFYEKAVLVNGKNRERAFFKKISLLI